MDLINILMRLTSLIHKSPMFLPFTYFDNDQCLCYNSSPDNLSRQEGMVRMCSLIQLCRLMVFVVCGFFCWNNYIYLKLHYGTVSPEIHNDNWVTDKYAYIVVIYRLVSRQSYFNASPRYASYVLLNSFCG